MYIEGKHRKNVEKEEILKRDSGKIEPETQVDELLYKGISYEEWQEWLERTKKNKELFYLFE